VGPKPLLPPPDSGEPSGQLWQFLMQPAVRQHVCKLAYAGECDGDCVCSGGWVWSDRLLLLVVTLEVPC
jgi:hypothetical protein